jgi:hypothetical protein
VKQKEKKVNYTMGRAGIGNLEAALLWLMEVVQPGIKSLSA